MYITIPHKKGVVNDLDTTDGVQRVCVLCTPFDLNYQGGQSL